MRGQRSEAEFSEDHQQASRYQGFEPWPPTNSLLTWGRARRGGSPAVEGAEVSADARPINSPGPYVPAPIGCYA